MKFIEKLQRFMYGRYGIDNLYKFLFKLYFVIFIINIFINLQILLYLELVLIIVMNYRFFSKKIYVRSRENQIYLNFIDKIKDFFYKIKVMLKRNDDYKYKRCRYCKQKIRLPLPNKRGIKHVRCPKCGKRLTVICFRKLKVEFVKG